LKSYAGQNLPATHARPTFSEAWFHQNYGLTFGERYYLDPILRTEQDREALRLLYDRFGQAGIGEKDPQPRPNVEICGHRLISALFGCEIAYQDNQAPSARHLSISSADEIAAIPRPDVATNRWAQEFRRQAAILLDRYHAVDSIINHGGPINAASSILGGDALLYLSDAPAVMTAFLNVIADVCVESYDRLTVPFSPQMGAAREMFIGNCPVIMMSPQMYRQAVLPADQRLRRQVHRFGLHHCGVMDRYLETYKCLEPMEYLEVGWGTDLAAARRAFPTAIFDLMINIYDLQNMPQSSIREKVANMLEQAQPVSLVRDFFVADIGPDVPDAKVLEFIEAVDLAVAEYAQV
jgi:uroporphyrinogen-III decarboxylase